MIVAPDGRSVNLRGEIIGLTTAQASIFDVLYDAWKNETPELSEIYILDTLGYEGGRVQDFFKRHHNWKKLIVKGQCKDFFRLNIDL